LWHINDIGKFQIKGYNALVIIYEKKKHMHVPWQRRHPRSSEWQCRSGWWSSGPSQFQCPPATATIIQQGFRCMTRPKTMIFCVVG
jgi:hypothetical protein